MDCGIGKSVAEEEEASPGGSTGVGSVEGMGKVPRRVAQRGQTTGIGTQRICGFGDGRTGRTSVGNVNFVVSISVGQQTTLGRMVTTSASYHDHRRATPQHTRFYKQILANVSRSFRFFRKS